MHAVLDTVPERWPIEADSFFAPEAPYVSDAETSGARETEELRRPRALLKAVVALARTFDLPDEPVSPVQRVQRWRGLRVGNLGLLVAHDCGGEIVEDARPIALPRTPTWCRGLINLRGQLIPAFDLHEALGLTRWRSTQQWWLALGHGNDMLAFLIDALPVSLSANESTSVDAAVIPPVLRSHAAAAFHLGGELWLEFRHLDFFRSLSSRPAP
jgi:hypothetical protein